jgi:hypothetical protein
LQKCQNYDKHFALHFALILASQPSFDHHPLCPLLLLIDAMLAQLGVPLPLQMLHEFRFLTGKKRGLPGAQILCCYNVPKIGIISRYSTTALRELLAFGLVPHSHLHPDQAGLKTGHFCNRCQKF